MAEAVIAEGLTKRYGGERGVCDVSFTVADGEICALLGRSGAGETTTMRVLVGLSRADRGAARLLGARTGLGAGVLGQVGVVIDGPAFVPHLSGMRNLKLLWRAGVRAWPPPALDRPSSSRGSGRRSTEGSAGTRRECSSASPSPRRSWAPRAC